MNIFRYSYVVIITMLCGCASVPTVQPRINSLVVAEEFDSAVRILEGNKQNYGERNHLLYLMDYGLVLHFSGQYRKSIDVFEQAKDVFDQHFTISLSKQATTWLLNDNFAPYRGEDFERVMINVFQALNFAALGDFEGALVEARDVDVKLKAINRQYDDDQKNTYTEDAFVRMFMGILYEASGSRADINDAFIAYRNAFDIYQRNYSQHYGLDIPDILKENLLSTAEYLGAEEFKEYKEQFDVDFISIDQKKRKAQVYLIHSFGLSPIKHQIRIPIPVGKGHLASIAFPHYTKRVLNEDYTKIFQAQSVSGAFLKSEVENGEDIAAIAIEELKRRKVRVIAKAAVRAAGRYVLTQEAKERIRKGTNDNAANWFQYAANLYNISSDQADLRSWQTLPAQIYISRLMLEPGEYQFYLDSEPLRKMEVKAGETQFILYRSNK